MTQEGVDVDISFETSGSFSNFERFLQRAPKANVRAILEACGQEGVRALSSATPQDSGMAAGSWYYTVVRSAQGWSVTWSNSDVESGYPVAVMIQYGHGTGTGGYVQGQDYINPALRPVFDKISNDIWKAVTTA